MNEPITPADPLAVPDELPRVVWEMPPYRDDEHRAAMCNWLRANGIDPGAIARRVVVTAGEPPMIHVSVYQRNERGRHLVDVAAQHVMTVPRIVPLRVEPPGGLH